MGQVLRIKNIDSNNEEIILVSKDGMIETWLGSLAEGGYRFTFGDELFCYDAWQRTYRSARDDMARER